MNLKMLYIVRGVVKDYNKRVDMVCSGFVISYICFNNDIFEFCIYFGVFYNMIPPCVWESDYREIRAVNGTRVFRTYPRKGCTCPMRENHQDFRWYLCREEYQDECPYYCEEIVPLVYLFDELI